MRLTPVVRGTMSDDVFDQLVGSIVGGEVAPGELLPSERSLAEALGVSRPVVREALKRLSHAGLVRIRHGGATAVADFQQTAGPDLLATLLVDRDGNLDLAVARALVQARSDLGPPVAAAAARRARAEQLDRLDDVLGQMLGTEDVTALQRLALQFWDVVVDAADNLVHRLLFNALRRAYEPVMDALAVVMRAEVTNVDGYAAVASALRAKDPQAAAAAVETLVSHGARAAIEAIDQLLDEEDPR